MLAGRIALRLFGRGVGAPHDVQCTICGRAAHVQRRVGLGLHNVDQRLAHQLEDGDESHRHAGAPLFRPEQLGEGHEAAALQRREHVAHALAHRQALAPHVMVREHLRARRHLLEGEQHLLQRHLRQHPRHRPVLELGARCPDVAFQPRQRVDVDRSAFETLVLLQPPHQLGARILVAHLAGGFCAAAACAT
jgi:hypothetical protein